MPRHIAIAFSMLFACASFAHAGAWTLPKGVNWFKVGLMYQDTTERYFLNGERIPYFFDGRNQTRALFFEYVRGLTDRWDVKVQLPVFAIAFDDFADERESNGLGDFRVESRYNVLDDPMVLTLGGAIKFPTGKFVNDAEIVPVGEGQYDFDVFAEVGRSLWPVNGYVTGKIGYRFRNENEETNIAFGDEIIWRAEVGYRFNRRWSTKVLARGLYGFESMSFGLNIETLRREVVYIEPGVHFAFTEKQGVEVTIPVSVRGRNWPAGPVFIVSFVSLF
jgi:hypothetical protein